MVRDMILMSAAKQNKNHFVIHWLQWDLLYLRVRVKTCSCEERSCCSLSVSDYFHKSWQNAWSVLCSFTWYASAFHSTPQPVMLILITEFWKESAFDHFPKIPPFTYSFSRELHRRIYSQLHQFRFGWTYWSVCEIQTSISGQRRYSEFYRAITKCCFYIY